MPPKRYPVSLLARVVRIASLHMGSGTQLLVIPEQGEPVPLLIPLTTPKGCSCESTTHAVRVYSSRKVATHTHKQHRKVLLKRTIVRAEKQLSFVQRGYSCYLCNPVPLVGWTTLASEGLHEYYELCGPPLDVVADPSTAEQYRTQPGKC